MVVFKSITHKHSQVLVFWEIYLSKDVHFQAFLIVPTQSMIVVKYHILAKWSHLEKTYVFIVIV